jgi:hypothetical protein
MDAGALKALQAPLKERYREKPESALITLKAEGRIGEGVTCSVRTGKALVEAGLHPATGGTGMHACSGDMLLEALVACAGVTLNSAARWAWPRRRPSASATSVSASRSTATSPRSRDPR